MNPIKAFVGHSFGESDKHVVRTFLDYFDDVRSVLAGFSWIHAERPEPRIVAEKVLELFSDRNVFIGICTRKELVVSPESLRPSYLSKNRYILSSQSAPLWKTSDWIIQEIGLALALKLKIILLLEEGVRVPGALQGDLEYIGFNRDTPSDSFSKILGMLGSLSRRVQLRNATPEVLKRFRRFSLSHFTAKWSCSWPEAA